MYALKSIVVKTRSSVHIPAEKSGYLANFMQRKAIQTTYILTFLLKNLTILLKFLTFSGFIIDLS